MKITETMLTEAVRFGNQQMSHIKRHQNQFKIGIEYEFKVHGNDYEGEIEEHMHTNEADEAVLEYLNENWGRYVNTPAEFVTGVLSDEFNSSLGEVAHLVAGIVGGNWPSKENLVQQGLDAVGSDLVTRGYIAASKQFDEDVVEAFKSHMDNRVGIEADLNDLKRVTETMIKAIVDMFGSFSQLPLDLDVPGQYATPEVVAVAEAITAFEEIAEDFEDSYLTNGSYQSNREILLWAFEDWDDYAYDARRDYADSIASKGVGLEYIRNTLYDSVSEGYIEAIVEDGSIPTDQGGEVITRPLGIQETFNVMDDIFDYIQNEGYTDDKTGMHVNMSHRKFQSIQDLNLLKLVVLLDPDFVQSRDLGNWYERNKMVQNLYDNLTPTLLKKIAQKLVNPQQQGMQMLETIESELRYALVTREKFSSVNFRSAIGYVNSSERRVEFRYFGGENYEYRKDDIERSIWFACYCMLAMVTDDFLRREYYEHLFKVLNRYCNKYFDMTFFDLVDGYRTVKYSKENGGPEQVPYSDQRVTHVRR